MSDDPFGMIAATQRAVDAMIPAPSHVVISERVARILIERGYVLSPNVTILMRDGTDRVGSLPEPRRGAIVHVHTPKPVGKRAKRRQRGKS